MFFKYGDQIGRLYLDLGWMFIKYNFLRILISEDIKHEKNSL